MCSVSLIGTGFGLAKVCCVWQARGGGSTSREQSPAVQFELRSSGREATGGPGTKEQQRALQARQTPRCSGWSALAGAVASGKVGVAPHWVKPQHFCPDQQQLEQIRLRLKSQK